MAETAMATVATSAGADLVAALGGDRVVVDPDILESYRRDRAAFALGGTITGEHGVGHLKQPYLSDMVGGAERALMARIKAAFDPAGILNPGKAI
jgi:FAD/FMN-containing dehydrogenase